VVIWMRELEDLSNKIVNMLTKLEELEVPTEFETEKAKKLEELRKLNEEAKDRYRNFEFKLLKKIDEMLEEVKKRRQEFEREVVKPPVKEIIDIRAWRVRIAYPEYRREYDIAECGEECKWLIEATFNYKQKDYTVGRIAKSWKDIVSIFNSAKLVEEGIIPEYKSVRVLWDHFYLMLYPEKVLEELYDKLPKKYELDVEKVELVYGENVNTVRITYSYEKWYKFSVFVTVSPSPELSMLNVQIDRAYLVTMEERRPFTLDEIVTIVDDAIGKKIEEIKAVKPPIEIPDYVLEAYEQMCKAISEVYPEIRYLKLPPERMVEQDIIRKTLELYTLCDVEKFKRAFIPPLGEEYLYYAEELTN